MTKRNKIFLAATLGVIAATAALVGLAVVSVFQTPHPFPSSCSRFTRLSESEVPWRINDVFYGAWMLKQENRSTVVVAFTESTEPHVGLWGLDGTNLRTATPVPLNPDAEGYAADYVNPPRLTRPGETVLDAQRQQLLKCGQDAVRQD